MVGRTRIRFLILRRSFHSARLGPDGRRYRVSLVQEPFDGRQSVVFRREELGWTGVASTMAGYDLLEYAGRLPERSNRPRPSTSSRSEEPNAHPVRLWARS